MTDGAIQATAAYKRRLDALMAAVASMPNDSHPGLVIGRAKQFERYLAGEDE